MKVLGLAFAATMATACAVDEGGAADNAQLTATEMEIINGRETSDFPSVVALYGQKPGEDKGALCTGTVVRPNVVLTAAHCVDPAVTGSTELIFNVLSGPTLVDQNQRPAKFAVREVKWHSGFNSQNLMGGNDIAVVITQDPLPLPVMDINLRPLAASMSGSKATLVGYGLNDGFGQTGAGIKRTASTAMKFDDKFVKTGSWFGTTICSGDSGGPIIATVNGKQTVVGVNSFGFIFCLGEASSTRVDAYKDWLAPYLN